MKTLLNFTPRLVAIVLLVLICSSLMANGTAATVVAAPVQSTVKIVASFALLLAVILLPLMIRRSNKALGK